MKKLLFILLLIPLLGLSQTQCGDLKYDIARTVSGKSSKPLDEQYIDFCNADSNKVLIGYRFILSDRKKDRNSWTAVSLYDPAYRYMFTNVNQELYIFVEWANFDKPKHVFEAYNLQYYQRHREPQHNKYYEVEPILRSPIPTFEGFVQWKKQLKK
jgi:hypothetical protein